MEGSANENYPQPAFDPVQNPADRQRLSRVLLEGAEDKRLNDSGWLAYMGQCVILGSQGAHNTTITHANRVYQARQCFRHEIGLHHQQHPLHRAPSRRGPHWPVPHTLLDTVAALDEITGDGLGALEACSPLVGKTGSSLRKQITLMERLAHTLGWEGDVRQAVAQTPRLLMRGPAKWMLLAHLAARHGDSEDTELSVAAISKLSGTLPEAHIQAALLKTDYRFGDVAAERQIKNKGIKATAGHIYEAVADEAVMARLGPAVVRAYLRYRPPTPEVLAANPQLHAHVPAKECTTLPIVRYVSGKEPWLVPLRATKRKKIAQLAAELNPLIAMGSKDLSSCIPGSSVYEATIDARANLFKALDLANPRHDTYEKFLSFMDQAPTLVTPQTILTACNLMLQYGVSDPLKVIRHVPRILLQPQQLEKRLIAISKCELDADVVLQYHPRLLADGRANIAHVLRSCRTAVRVRATEKGSALPADTPAGLLKEKVSDQIFDPLRYEQDFAALYMTTLDSEKLQDEQWVKNVTDYIIAGSQDLRWYRADERAAIIEMRMAFESAMGLHDPDHAFYVAYKRLGRKSILPITMMHTVAALQGLTGNALLAVMQHDGLLGIRSTLLLRRAHQAERLLQFLGWQGEASDLIRDYPSVLVATSKHQLVLARLAQKYATPENSKMSAADIAGIVHAQPEAHLLQILRGSTYTFGDKVSADKLSRLGVKNVRSYIQQMMATPPGAQKLGPALVKAYLQLRPLP